MDVLSRLKERKEMFVSFEGRNDRLIFDSHDEIESLRGEVERLISANEHWHARIITLKNDCGAYESSIEELEAEVERLKADGIRMDWIEDQATGYGLGWVARQSTTGRGFRLHETSAIHLGVVHRPDARAAIDHAMHTGRSTPKQDNAEATEGDR